MDKLSTLSTIIQAAERVDTFGPRRKNPDQFYQDLIQLKPSQLGAFAQALDTLVLNCKLLQHETVEINEHA